MPGTMGRSVHCEGHARHHGQISALCEGQARHHGQISVLCEGHARQHGQISALCDGHARHHGQISAPYDGHARHHGQISAPCGGTCQAPRADQCTMWGDMPGTTGRSVQRLGDDWLCPAMIYVMATISFYLPFMLSQ